MNFCWTGLSFCIDSIYFCLFRNYQNNRCCQHDFCELLISLLCTKLIVLYNPAMRKQFGLAALLTIVMGGLQPALSSGPEAKSKSFQFRPNILLCFADDWELP